MKKMKKKEKWEFKTHLFLLHLTDKIREQIKLYRYANLYTLDLSILMTSYIILP